MHFDHVPGQRRTPPSLMLEGLYDVRATDTYDVYNARTERSLSLVFHTSAGRGRIWIGEADLELTPDTLLIAPWYEIRRYRTEGSTWIFWCAVVDLVSGFDLPLRQSQSCPFDAPADAMWREAFALLSEQTHRAEQLAALRLATFLQHQAWARGESHQPQHPHEPAIRAQLRQLHDRLHAAPTVTELADDLQLSPRHYRHLFRQITGESPKAMIDRLRLARARELLRLTNQTISSIAADVGYSTVQQFSQAFSKTTGTTPTQWREKH